jgi:hypothetical protein
MIMDRGLEPQSKKPGPIRMHQWKGPLFLPLLLSSLVQTKRTHQEKQIAGSTVRKLVVIFYLGENPSLQMGNNPQGIAQATTMEEEKKDQTISV